MMMSRPKHRREDTCIFPPRQVSLNPTKMKEMRKIIKQEQDKTEKLIFSIKTLKILLSRVQTTKYIKCEIKK